MDIAFSRKVFYHMNILIDEGECSMKNWRTFSICALIGGAYGALGVFLASVFLKNLGALASWIMKIMQLEGDTASQVTDALMQLKGARLVSPYLVFMLIFAILSIIILRLVKRARGVVINAGAWLLLLIPVTLTAALFTHVNDILFLDMVKLLVSIVPNL